MFGFGALVQGATEVGVEPDRERVGGSRSYGGAAGTAAEL